jgi:cysteine sulfinate desulfinase/cysteine desulfurase-like protein
MTYLDHNATTPLAPEVREAMLPYLAEEWGNPSSSYRFGAKLKAVIETARGQVAELLGASSREIVFTSGATEANNTAIHAALKAHPARRHIVTSAVEHSSVLSCCRAFEADHQWTRIHSNRATTRLEAARGSPGVPLNRPADTFSPIGGEGRDEGDGYRVT